MADSKSNQSEYTSTAPASRLVLSSESSPLPLSETFSASTAKYTRRWVFLCFWNSIFFGDNGRIGRGTSRSGSPRVSRGNSQTRRNFYRYCTRMVSFPYRDYTSPPDCKNYNVDSQSPCFFSRDTGGGPGARSEKVNTCHKMDTNRLPFGCEVRGSVPSNCVHCWVPWSTQDRRRAVVSSHDKLPRGHSDGICCKRSAWSV